MKVDELEQQESRVNKGQQIQAKIKELSEEVRKLSCAKQFCLYDNFNGATSSISHGEQSRDSEYRYLHMDKAEVHSLIEPIRKAMIAKIENKINILRNQFESL